MFPIGRDNLKRSHARLAHTLSGLTDADARRPSLLPTWTVGHVLTHLARNAESHVRMLEAAAQRAVADQYPGGNEQRAADIEAGAQRSAADLVADVTGTAGRLESAWDATPEEAWRTGQGRVASGIWPLAELPFRRWREVEIHHVDLGLAYRIADWPGSYVQEELSRALAELPARLAPGTSLAIVCGDTGRKWMVPEGSEAARTVTGTRRLLLAWLLGRGGDPAFPVLAPWTG